MPATRGGERGTHRGRKHGGENKVSPSCGRGDRACAWAVRAPGWSRWAGQAGLPRPWPWDFSLTATENYYRAGQEQRGLTSILKGLSDCSQENGPHVGLHGAQEGQRSGESCGITASPGGKTSSRPALSNPDTRRTSITDIVQGSLLPRNVGFPVPKATLPHGLAFCSCCHRGPQQGQSFGRRLPMDCLVCDPKSLVTVQSTIKSTV